MADEIKLPPLPIPWCKVADADRIEVEVFRAFQMRDYAWHAATDHATAAEHMGFLRGLEAAANVADATTANPIAPTHMRVNCRAAGAAIRSLAATQQGDKP